MFVYILNFFIITLSIILFITPFFIWYWIKHKNSLGKIDLNLYLEYFFSSKQANWLIFAWAASEALFWFVIPEFLLLLVVFMRIRNKKQMLVYDIAGTVAGTILALVIRLQESTIAKLPYIQPGMISQTKTWYSEKGLLGLMHQPFSGVPYKVFTHLAWQYDFFIPWFIVLAVIVRIFRYLVAYGLFISLYPKMHKLIKNNYIPLALGAILVFSILLYNTYNLYR